MGSVADTVRFTTHHAHLLHDNERAAIYFPYQMQDEIERMFLLMAILQTEIHRQDAVRVLDSNRAIIINCRRPTKRTTLSLTWPRRGRREEYSPLNLSILKSKFNVFSLSIDMRPRAIDRKTFPCSRESHRNWSEDKRET